MRVTVVVNNFNYARFLSDAIQSALDQTWPDTEVVVVDDGSTDNSRAVISGFSDRIKVVLKDNGGQGSAYNAGYEAATGDAIIFLDADDMLLPTTVEKVANAFQTHPDAGKVQYRLAEVDAHGTPTGGVQPPLGRHMPSGDITAHLLRHHGYWWPPASGNCYTRDVLARVMPMPEAPFRIGADTWLAYGAVMVAPLVSIHETGGLLRLHGANHYSQRGPSGVVDRALRQLTLWCACHSRLATLAESVGLTGYPHDLRRIREVGFLVRRAVSLRLDRANHPIPGDRRAAGAIAGITSVLRQPHLGVRARAKLVMWFVVFPIAPKATFRRTVAKLVA